MEGSVSSKRIRTRIRLAANGKSNGSGNITTSSGKSVCTVCCELVRDMTMYYGDFSSGIKDYSDPCPYCKKVFTTK